MQTEGTWPDQQICVTDKISLEGCQPIQILTSTLAGMSLVGTSSYTSRETSLNMLQHMLCHVLKLTYDSNLSLAALVLTRYEIRCCLLTIPPPPA